MNITIIAIVLMVLVLIGMLVAKKTMANSTLLQPVLFLCVALELGLVIFVFFRQLSGDKGSVVDNHVRRYRAQGYVAGEFLKKTAGGKKLLIVHTAGAKTDKMRQGLDAALKEAYGSLEEDETKDNSSPEGDVVMIKAKDVNEVLARHKDADIIAFLSTFPEDFGQLKPGNPKAVYFLFDTGSADLAKVKKLIETDKVIGVIFPLKGSKVKYSDPVEKKESEAFAKRYILIDKAGLGANGGYF